MSKISVSDAGNGFRFYRLAFESGPLECHVSAACQYVTVWRGDERAAGTIVRRRVYASGPAWRAYDTNGAEIGKGFPFVSSAMRAIARHESARLAASRRRNVSQAALWSLYRYGANA